MFSDVRERDEVLASWPIANTISHAMGGYPETLASITGETKLAFFIISCIVVSSHPALTYDLPLRAPFSFLLMALFLRLLFLYQG